MIKLTKWLIKKWINFVWFGMAWRTCTKPNQILAYLDTFLVGSDGGNSDNMAHSVQRITEGATTVAHALRMFTLF